MADIIGRIGGTYKHPVVDEIPEELRPDEIVFVKGSGLWVGASENTFPTLDEGTPWPLKGYKEFVQVITQSGTDAPTAHTTLVNEIGTATWSRQNTGYYRLTFPSDSIPENKLRTMTGGFPFNLVLGQEGVAAGVQGYVSFQRHNSSAINLIISDTDFDAGVEIFSILGMAPITVSAKVYPPD